MALGGVHMDHDHLQKRSEAHFELLAREIVRLQLGTHDARQAYYRQQRDFLANALSGMELSEQQVAGELGAFDAAVVKLDQFVSTVAPEPVTGSYTQPPATRPGQPPKPAVSPRPNPARKMAIAAGALAIAALGILGFYFKDRLIAPDNSARASELSRNALDLASKKQYKQAIALYGEAIDLSPDAAYLYGNRANALVATREYDSAIEDFDAGIKLDPQAGYLYRGRGGTYYRKQKYEAAIRDYGSAIKHGQKEPSVYLTRGSAYEKKFKYKEALADYDAALRIDPANKRAKSMRAAALKKKQAHDLKTRFMKPVPGSIQVRGGPKRKAVRLVQFYRDAPQDAELCPAREVAAHPANMPKHILNSKVKNVKPADQSFFAKMAISVWKVGNRGRLAFLKDGTVVWATDGRADRQWKTYGKGRWQMTATGLKFSVKRFKQSYDCFDHVAYKDTFYDFGRRGRTRSCTMVGKCRYNGLPVDTHLMGLMEWRSSPDVKALKSFSELAPPPPRSR